jgi:hypothetical protein
MRVLDGRFIKLWQYSRPILYSLSVWSQGLHFQVTIASEGNIGKGELHPNEARQCIRKTPQVTRE